MRAYTIHDQNELYFLTWTIVGWIDVFTRQRYRDIVIESLKFCQTNKGLVIHAFVIMSNHVHLIVRAENGFDLSDILRDCKKYISKAIIHSILNDPESRRDWIVSLLRHHGRSNPNNTRYQLWQQKNQAIRLNDLRRLYQKLAYIHMNPVKAGIVIEPEHYLYSSARNYSGFSVALEVTLIEIVPLDGYLGPLG